MRLEKIKHRLSIFNFDIQRMKYPWKQNEPFFGVKLCKISPWKLHYQNDILQFSRLGMLQCAEYFIRTFVNMRALATILFAEMFYVQSATN